jgi:hypothetical protein
MGTYVATKGLVQEIKYITEMVAAVNLSQLANCLEAETTVNLCNVLKERLGKLSTSRNRHLI